MRYRSLRASWLLAAALVACSGGQTYDDGSDPIGSKPIKTPTASEPAPRDAGRGADLGTPTLNPTTELDAMPAPTSDPSGEGLACSEILNEAETQMQSLEASVQVQCTSDDECAVALEPHVACVPRSGCPELIGLTKDSLTALNAGLDALRSDVCEAPSAEPCVIPATPIACGDGTGQYEGRCIDGACTPVLPSAESECELPGPGPAMNWDARFAGRLFFEQTFEGETKSKDIEVELTFGDSLLPYQSLAALGYTGNGWRAYASGGDGPLSLVPLYEKRGVGTAYVYNMYEADGSANELTFTKSCASTTDVSMQWQYEVTYALTDLVDYRSYGYEDPDSPIATMSATETYTLDSDDTLLVDARSTGTVDGEAVNFTMTGSLSRIE